MKPLYILTILLVWAFKACAAEFPAEVRIIYSGSRPESLAVIYPEALEQQELQSDISYMKEASLALDLAVTTGTVKRNNAECTTVCYIINKAPFRPGSGNVLSLVVNQLKRYPDIEIECYGMPRPPRSSCFVSNKYAEVTGTTDGYTLDYRIKIKDPRFSRIFVPDIYYTEKRASAGIALILLALTGAFSIYALNRKR